MGGEVVIVESVILIGNRLWFEDSMVLLYLSVIWCGSLKRIIFETFCILYVFIGNKVGESGEKMVLSD